MAHVELSLTESFVPQSRPDTVGLDTLATGMVGTGMVGTDVVDVGLAGLDAVGAGSLQRWSAVALGAAEPSLVVDTDEIIIGASASCCELLGLGAPATAVGRSLLEEVRLIDFTANQAELTEPEMANIPPLLAVASGRLARGLLRVQPRGRPPRTVDAITTPLLDGGTVVGSLTFFAEV